MNIKRGDIYYADLSPVVGSEQGGLRPVLIVQNDGAQVRIKYISALYVHFDVPRNLFLLLFLSVLIFDGIDAFLIRFFREKIFHIKFHDSFNSV